MNRLVFFLLLASVSLTLHAQKIYATKTGQIRFNASTALENVAATNNQVDSKMVDKTGQIVFSALIKSFRFDNQLMEDHFNENYLESSKIPKAEFKGFITNASTINFSKDGKYPINVDGTLSLHGVSQKVTASGVMAISGGKPTITGSFKIKIKEYGITGLYIGEKIASEVEITINCAYD
ncbi:YceI family protein [Mucilaginibacter sp.]|uniref:YceI family protein n=1 Tax=Mucilaginibacter sp. TaxID=1882438 RepID=UPI00284A98F7|nr:YceI family protein [Mucilaginibacter sp.]MDR3695553.1 YceI family protein [Mucilaginibacter sp.]